MGIIVIIVIFWQFNLIVTYEVITNLIRAMIMEDKNITLVQTETNEISEISSNLTGSTMTKAGRLAM